MSSLSPFASAGVAVLLAVVIGYLLNSNRADRKEHRAERQEWDSRFQAQQNAYDKHMAEARVRVDELEKELRSERLRADAAQTKLEGLARGTGHDH